jgi:hypothetical protein
LIGYTWTELLLLSGFAFHFAFQLFMRTRQIDTIKQPAERTNRQAGPEFENKGSQKLIVATRATGIMV